MMLKHRFLLTGFAILSVAVLVGGASARSTESSASLKHHHRVQLRHTLSSYSPVAPVVPVVAHPDCYLPSDGCPSEYTVQNLGPLRPLVGFAETSHDDRRRRAPGAG